MGEFVGGGEPEFQGVVQVAEPTEADAGESAVSGLVQAIMVFRGGGLFESEQGFSKAVGETFVVNQDGGEAREVVVLFIVHRGQDDVTGFQFLSKTLEEFDNEYRCASRHSDRARQNRRGRAAGKRTPSRRRRGV